MSPEIVTKITGFLNAIGIETVMRPIVQATFLPGLLLEKGTIVIDTDKLLHPGDILHEAGHLAAYAPEERKTISDPLPETMADGFEIMALAWSYAACLYISLDPSVVFHAEGYKGEGGNILKNFAEGRYIGVPMLQYLGLAYDAKKALELNVPPYPVMIRWLR